MKRSMVCQLRRKNGVPVKMKMMLRLTAVFILFFSVQVSAGTYSQTVTVTGSKVTLSSIFSEIRKQAGYAFVCEKQLLKNASPVTLRVKNAPVDDVMALSLKGQNLAYDIKSDTIIIFPAVQAKMIMHQEAFASPPLPAPVTGRITDTAGQPLAGVTVTVKGTKVSVTTDDNGNFSVNVPAGYSTLSFSYVGYTSQDVAIGNNSTVSIRMTEEAKDLNQVVVVGYGTQKKVSLTSAVGTIKADDVSRRVVSNAQQALQGLTPGLAILDQGGAPGRSNATMRIRGTTTLSGNNPLVLVDGIEQGFNNFNPDDIESVSVLKDAAATAIYGSRAAAGVVLITTKRAREGKLNIAYNGYVGFQTTGNHPHHMATADYMRQQDTAYAHAGQAMPYSDSLIRLWNSSSDRIKYPLANDWYNVLYHTAPQYNNNLTVSGGNKQFRGLMNVRLMQQDGIVDKFSNNIQEVRLNTDFIPSDKIRFSVDANYRALYSQTPQDDYNVFYNTLHGAQFATPRFPDGGYGLSAQGNSPLVTDQLSGYNKDWFNYFAGNLRGEWQIVRGLKLSTQYGIVSTSDRNKIFRNSYSVVDENYPSRTKTVSVNQLTENRTNSYMETLQSLLEYRKKISEHSVTLLGGYSQLYTRGDNIFASRTNLYNNQIQALSQGALSTRDNGGADFESGLRSYFGRLNYDFAGRYLLEANGRYDGSSNFTGDNLYSFFPSFSAGWRLSQEGFWKGGLSDVLPEFKVRGSWGKTGNQTVSAYSFYDALSVQNYNFGGNAATGYTLLNYANTDLKWETTTQTDIGLDAVVLNKFNVTADYYNKKTSGILLQLAIPSTVGLTAPFQNAGVVSNKGWEVAVNYRGGQKDFHFDLTFNLANNINKVVDLKGTGPYITGSTNDALYVNKVGLPVGALWGFKTNGLYRNQKDVDTSAKYDPNTFPGDVKYLDINHDGKITADDRTKVGDPFPHYMYGLTSSFQYKNFDAYFLFQGVAQQDARISGAFADAGNNQGFVINLENDYWTPSNPDARFPRPQKFTDKNAQMSDFWVIRMGYFRVKNLQLGYNIPKNLTGRMKIQKARLYISGTNLFTISKGNEWGIDPEFPSGRAAYYPQTKVYTVGVNVNF